MREAKIVVCTRPWASTAGPPELPCRTTPRSVVTSRRNGPRPYASSVRNSRVWPIRPAVAVNGPFSGIAEDRHGLSLDGIDQAERRRAEPGDSKDSDVVAGIEGDDVGVAGLPVVVVDACVLHPGDDVRVRDDEIRRGDPARAFDPEPARRPDDAEDTRARQADSRTVEQRRIGRRDAAAPARESPRTGRRERLRRAAATAARAR